MSLKGSRARPVGRLDPLATAPLNVDHPLLAGLDGGINAAAGSGGPAVAVDDDSSVALGHYAGTDALAAAARDFGQWRSVFVGAPRLSDAFIHNLAARCLDTDIPIPRGARREFPMQAGSIRRTSNPQGI